MKQRQSLKKNFLAVLTCLMLALITICASSVLTYAADTPTPEVPQLKLSASSATLYLKGTKTLTATYDQKKVTPTWKTSNSAVVSVSSSGKLTAKKAGTATITATYKKQKAVCSVTVKNPSIKLNKTSLSVEEGKSYTLKATVRGTSKTVTWSTSNSSIATVSKGKVIGKKAGTVTIKATANGVSTTCKVKIKLPDYASLYRSFLAKSTVPAGSWNIKPDYFYVLNLDRTGVPELIISQEFSRTFFVYTVISGKVRYLGECSKKGMVGKPYITYSSTHKSIQVDGWINGVGGVWSANYAISKSKLIQKHYACEYANADGHGSREYYTAVNGASSKKVSKSTYVSFVNKYLLSKYYKQYNMLTNTLTNRNNIK